MRAVDGIVRRPAAPHARARVLIASLVVVFAPTATASAQPTDAPEAAAPRDVLAQAESGAFLPGISRARNGYGYGVGYVLSGYDGVNASATFVASTEAVLWSRLALRLGGVYLPSSSTRAMQPQLELRFQLSSQEGLGIDSSVALVYRRDKITQDGGIVECVLAVGRRVGRVSTILNVAYGQDGEGDDRLTEVRAAGLLRVRRSWVIGASGSASTGWGSSDPRRAGRNEIAYQVLAGPTAAYAVEGWTLLAQSGFDYVDTTRSASGIFVFGGVGTSF
jgi:hypothetical protein